MANYSAKEYVDGVMRINGIESVRATLKRGCNGTCHNFSKKRVDYHANAFPSLFNKGNCQADIMGRMEALTKETSRLDQSYAISHIEADEVLPKVLLLA